MKNSVVSLEFNSYKWSDLVHFAMFISLMFFNCSLFGTSPFTKAAFDAAILDLQTKGVIAFIPLAENLENRDKALETLLTMLGQLASHVNMIAIGDKIVIIKSGFKVRIFTNHNPKKGFSVVNGIFSGQVIAKWGKKAEATSYIVRYSINEDGKRDVYTQIGIGKTGLTIKDLIKGKEYMFSLAVIYADHQGEFCSPIKLIIL
jgi:hypothetical protein